MHRIHHKSQNTKPPKSFDFGGFLFSKIIEIMIYSASDLLFIQSLNLFHQTNIRQTTIRKDFCTNDKRRII